MHYAIVPFSKNALRMTSSKSRHPSKRVAVLWSLSRMRRIMRITFFLVRWTRIRICKEGGKVKRIQRGIIKA